MNQNSNARNTTIYLYWRITQGLSVRILPSGRLCTTDNWGIFSVVSYNRWVRKRKSNQFGLIHCKCQENVLSCSKHYRNWLCRLINMGQTKWRISWLFYSRVLRRSWNQRYLTVSGSLYFKVINLTETLHLIDVVGTKKWDQWSVVYSPPLGRNRTYKTEGFTNVTTTPPDLNEKPFYSVYHMVTAHPYQTPLCPPLCWKLRRISLDSMVGSVRDRRWDAAKLKAEGLTAVLLHAK